MKKTGDRKKRAFITGISGQDGYYLSHFLSAMGYEIYGLDRDAESETLADFNQEAKSHIKLFTGDLVDADLVRSILNYSMPDEVYNLAAVSDLATSIKNPELAMKVNCDAPARMLEEIFKVVPGARVFLASSAQIFDKSNPPQNELTPFRAENPYAVAKLKLHQEYVLPFQKKGLYVCSGFLFNHESPRRDERFVIRKITKSLVKIKLGLLDCLELGNLGAIRDWGFAGDYVQAMWKMLQQPKPDNFIIATGQPHTVRDLVEAAAGCLGMQIKWRGQGLDEVGLDKRDRIIIRVNQDFYRPEAGYFLGDISKIKKSLGWQPEVNFQELIRMMVKNDLKLFSTA